jgi:ribonuclease HI
MKSLALNNNLEEVLIKSDCDFPKRARDIVSCTTIGTYTDTVLKGICIDLEKPDVTRRQLTSQVPSWELMRASFDTDYCNLEKSNNPLMLAETAKLRVSEKYANHLKVYTDGSLIEEKKAGSGFVIPALNISKSYFLGIDKSIFTAEMMAILMALRFLNDFSRNLFYVLVCVDSKSVLSAIRHMSMKVRPEMVIEICQLIHSLSIQGTDITFCWLPSHCNIYYNDKADIAAKKGAKESDCSISLNVALSLTECNGKVDNFVWKEFQKQINHSNNGCFKHSIRKVCKCFSKSGKTIPRSLQTIMCRWKLDGFRTKYVKEVTCICNFRLSPDHILKCKSLRPYISILNSHSVDAIFSEPILYLAFFQAVLDSPVGYLL